MNGRLLDLHVCVRGRPLPEYLHNGTLYVEGRSGTEYVLRLRNRTGKRIEVVLTVDGVSVVDGSEGSVGGTGYVLAPWQTTDIKGFLRSSGMKAAAFLFGGAGDSYRAKLGRGVQHLGVVGAVVFEEKVTTPDYSVVWHLANPYPQYSAPSYSKPGYRGILRTSTTTSVEAPVSVLTAQVMGGSQTQTAPQNLGTSYGQEVDFWTSKTTFDRATETPAERLEIHYDDAEGLRRRGVDIGTMRPTPPAPSAFPADEVKGCPAPEGWSPTR